MAIPVILSLDQAGQICLKSPYAPALVQALKEQVPYSYRTWDAATKVWRIDPDWGDVLVTALEGIGVAIIDNRPVAPQAPVVSAALQEACTRLHVMPDAPVLAI